MTSSVIPIGFEVSFTDGLKSYVVAGKLARDWREKLSHRGRGSTLSFFEIISVSYLWPDGQRNELPRAEAGRLVHSYAEQIKRAVKLKHAQLNTA